MSLSWEAKFYSTEPKTLIKSSILLFLYSYKASSTYHDEIECMSQPTHTSLCTHWGLSEQGHPLKRTSLPTQLELVLFQNNPQSH